MTIRAGRLGNRITFQRRTTARGASGDLLGTWQDYARVSAAIAPKLGHETPTGYAKVMTSFQLRYLAGVDPAMRIVTGSKVYDITSIVDVDNRHRELVIMAQELVGVAP